MQQGRERDHGIAGRGHRSGAAFAQAPRTGGPTPLRSRCRGVLHRPQGRRDRSGEAEAVFRFAQYGCRSAGSDRENSGHHHLLIDTELPALDKPIPNDFNHLHFGTGQTEAEITLKPGEHTLQLLMGDKDHVPHSPPVMSPRIRVRVADGSTGRADRRSRPSPPGAEVYFTDLKDGAVIPPKPTIYFG